LIADVAIGAPYEGSGVVYIYHGAGKGEELMSDTYVQRIVGKEASLVDYSLHLKLYDNISNSTEVCQSMAIFLNIILVKINYSLAHLQI